ncbi:MAG: hypothetical protein WAN11_00905 [Syntrophobacteraceae bacterium]
MAKTLYTIRALCIMAALLGVGAVAVFSQPGMLSARIGILIDSGEQLIRARGQERIKPGDWLRIYVQPEEACHVYIVHTDHKTVTLLGTYEEMSPGAQLVLPGLLEFYEVDGESPTEAFTIICSTVKLNDISALFNSKVTYKSWAAMEEKLLKQGKIDLSQKPDKPSPIAGNVRALTGSNKDDPFILGLPIYSGNNILVKRYEFNVKK